MQTESQEQPIIVKLERPIRTGILFGLGLAIVSVLFAAISSGLGFVFLAILAE